MAGTDDLAPLLTGQASGKLVTGQATVVSWNPADYTHTLDFRGSQIGDVGVLHGVSALGYKPGDVVMLLGWVPERGTSSWWILGRALVPGQDSPDLVVRGSNITVQGGASIQVSGGGSIEANGGPIVASDETGDVFRVDPTVPEIFMRPELITSVARLIVGDAVSFDSVAVSGSRTGGSFGTFGTITGAGPELTFDVINGSFIALWGARIDVTADVGEDVAAFMDVEVNGPTPSSPPDSPALGTGAIGRVGASSESGTKVLRTSVMTARLYTVDPGEYTVECLYRVDDVSGSPPLSRATWQQRFLLIIAF